MQLTVHHYGEANVGASSSYPQSTAGTNECLHSFLCFALLYSLGTNPCLEDGATHGRLGLPHQLTQLTQFPRDMSTGTQCRQTSLRFSSQVIQGYVKLAN